jgi:LPS-assembly lipoprotein
MLRRTVLSSLALTTLGGCGFRLRGSVSAPTYTLSVRGPTGGVGRALVSRLRAGGQGVWLAGDPKAPATTDYVLVIREDSRQRVVQGSNVSGQVRELNLKLNFRWSLLDANDVERLAPNDIVLEQDMSFNETDVLGKSEEEGALFDSLQERAVQRVISQLARVPQP